MEVFATHCDQPPTCGGVRGWLGCRKREPRYRVSWAIGNTVKTSFVSSISVVVLVAIGACAKTASPVSDKSANPVSEMLRAMRSETYAMRYDVHAFPKLCWTDIPELLTFVESTNALGSFPINGFSSQRVSQCTEGMMALWLTEGIRVGGKFPSQIPECYDKSIAVPSNALFFARAEQKSLATAYAAWWKKVKDMTREQGCRYDPLDGTALTWFGGRDPRQMEK